MSLALQVANHERDSWTSLLLYAMGSQFVLLCGRYSQQSSILFLLSRQSARPAKPLDVDRYDGRNRRNRSRQARGLTLIGLSPELIPEASGNREYAKPSEDSVCFHFSVRRFSPLSLHPLYGLRGNVLCVDYDSLMERRPDPCSPTVLG